MSYQNKQTKKFHVPPDVLEQVRELAETNDYFVGYVQGAEKWGTWSEKQWVVVSRELGIPMPSEQPSGRAAFSQPKFEGEPAQSAPRPTGGGGRVPERSYLVGQALMALVIQKLKPTEAAQKALAYADAVMEALYPKPVEPPKPITLNPEEAAQYQAFLAAQKNGGQS